MEWLSAGMVLALAAACCWSLYDLLRRFLTGKMSAWVLVVWVTVGALPVVMAWGLWANDWRLGEGYWVPGLASTALNVVANFAYFRSFQLSPISVTLPMLSLTPVFSSLLGAAVLGEPVGPRAAGGIVLVVAGAALLSAGRKGVERRFRLEPGSLLMAVVALCWSTTLLLDKLAVGRASVPLHALVLNAGVAIGGLFALAATRRLHLLSEVRGNVVLLIGSVVVGVSALCIQLVAIQQVPIGMVETLKRGIGGLFAVIWGRSFFGEGVTTRKVGAVVLLGCGVALILL